MRLIADLVKLVLVGIAGLFVSKYRRPRERIVEPVAGDPRAELVVVALVLAGGLAAAAFVVLYAIDASTQVLGLALGGSLALIAVALIVLAKRLVPTEHLEEPYAEPHEETAEEVAQILREGGSGFTRKRLLGGAATATGTALGAAALTPALSLGPALDTNELRKTPWRRGIWLVDDRDRPYKADDIEEGDFYTAYPRHERHDVIGSPIVLVRLAPSQLRLPPGREGWAPEGIVAYSKVCTHAGCAIALYRSPLFDPTQPNRALVCPCHYSTFDPAQGAKVLFGPAGRPLPQLPLMIGPQRHLLAAGDFSGPVGPSWAGVRRGRAQ